MTIYLEYQEAITYLNMGRTIEQWIGINQLNDATVINWLSIAKTKNDGFSVSYYQSFDEGSENNLDLYEFNMTDPDSVGTCTLFPDAKSAIEYALQTYCCKYDRFVNSGMIQEEYKMYLQGKI